jgi:uncharacterized membrane protein
MEEAPSMRLPSSIFAVLILYGVLQARFYSSKMPEVMASHFGASGRPNGWQTHSAVFLTELLVVSLAGLVGFVLPWTMKAIPVSLMNLPNKDHWLAPDRRAGTLAYFRVQFAWMGSALLAFLLFVMELAFRANLATPHQLNNRAFIAGLVTFLVFTTAWSIRFIVHFSSGSQ